MRASFEAEAIFRSQEVGVNGDLCRPSTFSPSSESPTASTTVPVARGNSSAPSSNDGSRLCGRAQTSLGAIVKLCNPNMLDATTLKQVNEGLNKVLGLARSAANAKAQLEKAGLNPLGQEGAKVCLSSYLFV